MSKFYIYAKTYGNNILAKYYENGQQVIEKIPFKPKLYVPSDDQNSEWKSFYDKKPLSEILFQDIKSAKDYIRQYEDVTGFEIHGFTKFEYQWINSEFQDEIDYDPNAISFLLLDIEVVGDENEGFPDIQMADQPIVLMSLYNSKTGKTIVLGVKDYVQEDDDDFTYKKFNSELELLKFFIAFNKHHKFDIWSGWNTSQFDIPYLVNRINRLMGIEMVKMLSPFNIVKERNIFIRGKEVQTYDIYGVIDLDYLELYKKFGTYSAKPSYALGYIAKEELGKSKVELDGDTFYDSYHNHTKNFIKYNAVDTLLVKELDDKKKLFDLAYSLTYLYKCNFQDIYKTVLPWEVYIYNHLSKSNIAVPPRKQNDDVPFEGAWVKEPVPGMYGWHMSFDFSSLYPSIIRQWNISPETFVNNDKYQLDVQKWLRNDPVTIDAAAYANSINCTIAVNGTMYRKNEIGVIPQLLKLGMDGRKIAKNKMLELESEYQRTKDETLLSQISTLDARQQALKTSNNSLYGALGSNGFHYYNWKMAEAITLNGQLSDKHLAFKINDMMNKFLSTTDVDYVTTADTDSVYVNVQKIVDLFCKGKDNKQIVEYLDTFGDKVCQKVINNSVDHIYNMMNCYERIMGSKREAIASKALFRGKKNYAMYVHNSEGVDYDPPKLKIMGIEVVRSSTPKWCSKNLKECIKLMFEQDEVALQSKYKELEREFKTLSVEDIAFPRGVSDIDKWYKHPSDKFSYRSGCPIHVRSSIVYNKAIHHYNLNLDSIQSGDKVKYVYLHTPNPIRENVIGFPTNNKLPVELGLHKYVDYKTQFEKSFKEPLKSLTDVAGWKLEKVADLSSFFE